MLIRLLAAESPHSNEKEVAILVDDGQFALIRQAHLIQSDLGDLARANWVISSTSHYLKLVLKRPSAVVDRLSALGVEQMHVLLVRLIAYGQSVVGH